MQAESCSGTAPVSCATTWIGTRTWIVPSSAGESDLASTPFACSRCSTHGHPDPLWLLLIEESAPARFQTTTNRPNLADAARQT
jgi:hypothetical protein